MTSQQQLSRSKRSNNGMFENKPYFNQRSLREQEACMSLMSLGLQQQQPTIRTSLPLSFQSLEQFLNVENLNESPNLNRKRVHLEISSEMSETSESDPESFENELKQKTRSITRTRTKTKSFKRTSRSKLVSQKRIILKHRNKTKSTIKTTTRKTQRSKSQETRPKAFAHLRVFWSKEECCCLIDGINRFGVGKWAKIMRQSEYSFHVKRTPHDLKDKWRNLTKFEDKESIQIKYKYKQWVENRQLNQQLN
ncbi:telomeric repeat-binding factor 1 [Anaeramoeba flamelloides]|uniref:Telomeric repeat-binding factor 1 n=1 Tax=Anaeramoeba flamelloides TaxID=1746091 RepID=A0ABQ8XDU9_9EUKA|nr:telomeric repeat-binding factor 1 [Anaeramoeba flamelloides]